MRSNAKDNNPNVGSTQCGAKKLHYNAVSNPAHMGDGYRTSDKVGDTGPQFGNQNAYANRKAGVTGTGNKRFMGDR